RWAPVPACPARSRRGETSRNSSRRRPPTRRRPPGSPRPDRRRRWRRRRGEGCWGAQSRAGKAGRRRAAAEGSRVGGRRHVTAIVAVLVYKVPPARRAPHLSCARPEPEVLQVPGIQRDAQRTDGGDMGRAMVARLGLGLLLLALLLPTQIYSTVTTSAPLSSNSSQNTSTTPNPANTTTKAVGGALQSTASLFVVSLSLLHLYC
uniref:Signal transducer CD24 n=1 Tax=Macaca fascicularis TaxID=9541 RepID=A0A7N9CVY4_MACFA